MKSRTSCLGSARASRAGDAAPGIANFSTEGDGLRRDRIDCGEAPQSTREARALPRIPTPRRISLPTVLFACALLGCETSNYVPPVTSAMTGTGLRAKQGMNSATLERGRTLFAHRCIECHTLPPMWKYSREDWPQIVNDMSHRASLKPEEREAVIAYILAVRKNER